MADILIFQQLADSVLALHFAVVAFVLGGLVFIIIGNFMRWRWVNALWFRLAHLAAIAVVAARGSSSWHKQDRFHDRKRRQTFWIPTCGGNDADLGRFCKSRVDY